MSLTPITEDFVFTVSDPVVRAKVEELLGHKHTSIPKLHRLLADETLSEHTKQFEWMIAMKHFQRQLEHLLQEICIRRNPTTDDTDSEDDMDPEEKWDYDHQKSYVASNPWDWCHIDDADKYNALLDHMIKIHDVVSSHHMYLRDRVYKQKTS
jgi:hypothetical protein